MRRDKWGINFQDIPREDVPFDWSTLENYDSIKNNHGHILLYLKEQKHYRFVNNDVTRFISEESMMGECNEHSFITNDFSKSPWHKL